MERAEKNEGFGARVVIATSTRDEALGLHRESVDELWERVAGLLESEGGSPGKCAWALGKSGRAGGWWVEPGPGGVVG
eukprot:364675-Chlamydomonas_euryale.AAC.9